MKATTVTPSAAQDARQTLLARSAGMVRLQRSITLARPSAGARGAPAPGKPGCSSRRTTVDESGNPRHRPAAPDRSAQGLAFVMLSVRLELASYR